MVLPWLLTDWFTLTPRRRHRATISPKSRPSRGQQPSHYAPGGGRLGLAWTFGKIIESLFNFDARYLCWQRSQIWNENKARLKFWRAQIGLGRRSSNLKRKPRPKLLSRLVEILVLQSSINLRQEPEAPLSVSSTQSTHGWFAQAFRHDWSYMIFPKIPEEFLQRVPRASEKALHASVFNWLKYHQKPKQMLRQQPRATKCLELDLCFSQVA